MLNESAELFDPENIEAPKPKLYLGRMADRVVIVSPEDADLLTQYRWTLNPCGKRTGKPKDYARTSRCKANEYQQTYLHQLVASRFLGPRPPKSVVDHVNGDTFDNRRENLRYLCAFANRWRWS